MVPWRRPHAHLTARTGHRRPCSTAALAGGELFLLSDTNTASFDRRYFGPIAVLTMLSIAQPLWTWDAP